MKLSILALLVSTYASAAPGLNDGFESGTLSTSEQPPGQWDSYVAINPGITVEVSPDAARSGSFGFRLRDSDGSSTATPGVATTQNFISFAVGSAGGAFHLRTWFRLTSTNQDGSFSIAQLYTNAEDQPLAELTLHSGGTLCVLGHYKSGTISGFCSTNKPVVGAWHRLELEITGVGTSNGKTTFRMDGADQNSPGSLNWSGLSVDEVRLGQPFTTYGEFIGIVDFDDVVAAPGPVGAVTLVPASADVQPGETLDFAAFGGNPPYNFTLDVAPSGGAITPDGAYSAGAVAGRSDVVRVTDAIGGTATASVQVAPGPPDRVRVLPVGSDTVAACEPATVEVAVVDAHGNVVEAPSTVNVCAEGAASVLDFSLTNAVRSGSCVTGDLPPSGRATVSFVSEAGGTTAVIGTHASLAGPSESASLSWEAGVISIVLSGFSFDEAQSSARLPVSTGLLTARVGPRDTCDQPLSVESTGIRLRGDAPLQISEGMSDPATSSTSFQVTLPVCPNEAELLSLRAEVRGRALTNVDGSPRELKVDPDCSSDPSQPGHALPDGRALAVGCHCGVSGGPGTIPFAALVLLALHAARSRRADQPSREAQRRV